MFYWMWLTGCGHEVEETLLGEQWVFQTPEVELKNACHRVDVMITLIIHQRILSYRHSIHLIHSLILHCYHCSCNMALRQYKLRVFQVGGVNLNIESAVMFPHLLLVHDADLTYHASKMVYMSIRGLHVTYGGFICTLESRGRDCGLWGGKNAI